MSSRSQKNFPPNREWRERHGPARASEAYFTSLVCHSETHTDSLSLSLSLCTVVARDRVAPRRLACVCPGAANTHTLIYIAEIHVQGVTTHTATPPRAKVVLGPAPADSRFHEDRDVRDAFRPATPDPRSTRHRQAAYLDRYCCMVERLPRAPYSRLRLAAVA